MLERFYRKIRKTNGDNRLQTSDFFGRWTSVIGNWTSDHGRWTSNIRQRITDFGDWQRTLKRQRTSDIGLYESDLSLRIQNSLLNAMLLSKETTTSELVKPWLKSPSSLKLEVQSLSEVWLKPEVWSLKYEDPSQKSKVWEVWSVKSIPFFRRKHSNINFLSLRPTQFYL